MTIDDLTNDVATIFMQHDMLTQVQLEGPGGKLFVWYLTKPAPDIDDPSTWETNGCFLEDIEQSSIAKNAAPALRELQLASVECEITEGVFPRVWHRQASF